ncbi:MAG TPA: ferritin-like domain-containing protein [Burkholderiaceae bacterium]|nr:ferritin-like domain-containing protein [Burkholderiaceae bacterium]
MTPVEELRRRARQQVSDGPVTADYGLNPQEVVHLLNEALATELVCVLRYKRHYYMAQGLNARFAADEFLEHANQEAEHADRLAGRIVQLGGAPDFNPQTLVQRSHAQYHAGTDLQEMLYEDLVAERIAIESYRELVRYLGDRDPTPRRLLEEILAVEEEHADDLVDLMTESSPQHHGQQPHTGQQGRHMHA